MRQQIIGSFFDVSRWRFDLYEAVFGSAVAGNTDAREAVRHPDDVLTSRTCMREPYYRAASLRLIKVNQLWQRFVGRLNGARIVPDNKVKALLSCPLPGVRLVGQSSPGYACKCNLCPNCYYRRLVTMYGLFCQCTEPGMHVYEHTLTSWSPTTPQVTPKLVETNNEIMSALYRKRQLPWVYGASTSLPTWHSATDDRSSTWRYVTRTLAVVDADTPVNTGTLSVNVGPSTGNVHEEACRHIGEATPRLILDTLCNDFRYPAAILYENIPDTNVYSLYAALRGNGKRSACRARSYGLRRQTCELEEKGAFNVTDYNEQCFHWRSAFETADVDEPAGDQGRRLRLSDADNRILCPAQGLVGVDGRHL